MNETLLSPQTYAVLQRVPPDWMDESEVKHAIATALGIGARNVAMSLTRLRVLSLVERRAALEVERSAFELRKTARANGA